MKCLIYFTILLILYCDDVYSQNKDKILQANQKGDNNIQVNYNTGTLTIYNNEIINKDVVDLILKGMKKQLDLIVKSQLDTIIKSQKQIINYLISNNITNDTIKNLLKSINKIEEKNVPDTISKDNIKYFSVNKLSKDTSLFIPISVCNNYAVIKYRNKYGMLNDSGKLILDYKYDFIDFNGDTNFIAVSKNKIGYYINIKEQVSLEVTNANKVYSFQDTIARVVIDSLYGLIGKSGKFVLKPKYNMVFPFINGIAFCGSKTTKGGWRVSLINCIGEILIDGYTVYDHDKNYNYFLLAKQNNNGLKSSSWKGWIIINKNGKSLSNLGKHHSLPHIESNSKGFIVIEVDHKKGYLFDSLGNVILNYEKCEKLRFANDTLLALTIDNKCNLVDFKGHVVLDDNYHNIYEISDSFFEASRIINNKIVYGIVNINGLEILPFCFSKIQKNDNGHTYIGYLYDDIPNKNKEQNKKDSIKKTKESKIEFDQFFNCIKNCDLLRMNKMLK